MSGKAIDKLVRGVVAKEPRSIARACRVIDDRDPRRFTLLTQLYKTQSDTIVLGVTGTPGAGKSTLIDGMVQHCRAQGQRVAVVAIDPSSPFSGGAILGDRIRMQQHFVDQGVFIRSIATRGHLGGLSRSSSDVLCVLRAAKFDVVIVETVGVGQDELEVARIADTTVVVTAPGLGDDVQASKAGILEIADVFVINKSDHKGADAVVQDLQQMLSLGRFTGAKVSSAGHAGAAALRKPMSAEEGQWLPPILKTIADKAEGIGALMKACRAHQTYLCETPEGAGLSKARREAEFRSILEQVLLEELDRAHDALITGWVEKVISGQVDPYAAAQAVTAAISTRSPR